SPGSTRHAYLLDTPVVLDGSIDESIDRDCANGEALALLRITRRVFAGIGAEDAVSQYHLVIYREKIVHSPDYRCSPDALQQPLQVVSHLRVRGPPGVRRGWFRHGKPEARRSSLRISPMVFRARPIRRCSRHSGPVPSSTRLHRGLADQE